MNHRKQEKPTHKEAFQRGIEAGNAVMMRKMKNSCIGMAIAFPIMSLWLLYGQISIGISFGNVKGVYWFTIFTSFTAALLTYLLFKYIRYTASLSWQYLSIMVITGAFFLSMFGFAASGVTR
jgi:hypothetical protein